MRETPPSGHPRNAKPSDSEAPTQFWDSPLKDTTEFSVRRAARRRERLEALLKGYDATNTSTELVPPPFSAEFSSPGDHVSPPPLPEVPEPPSLPTGTYTSVRPVTGPRLAVFVALGVAVGGLAALQLDRVLSPTDATPAAANAARSPQQNEAPRAEAPEATEQVYDSTEEVLAMVGEAQMADVPPLQVEVVQLRPPNRIPRANVVDVPPQTVATANVSQEPPATSAFAPNVNQSACSRYPTVHIPTQLHPRVNPLMTSSQVFTGGALPTPSHRRSEPQ
jgi:hypothetical protein